MSSSRRVSLGLAALALCPLIAGCGGDRGGARHTTPSGPIHSAQPHALGTLGPGFYDQSEPPGPEDTIHPSPGSWDDVRPRAGYRVALIVDGVPSDAGQQTAVLQQAVTDWADESSARLTVLTARRQRDYVDTIQQAIDTDPDLVISVGNGLVDPLAMVSAPNLETEFLLVGAEIAEPTTNVTAADWHGAMYRGEGLGLPERYDASTFTAERAGRAVRAGVAAVLNRLTGIVVEVD